MADQQDSSDRPIKRIKLLSDADPAEPAANMANAKEIEVGINNFVVENCKVLHGTLKKRYTDFIVNEILPDGRVLHLQSTRATRKTNRQTKSDGHQLDSSELRQGEDSGHAEEANATGCGRKDQSAEQVVSEESSRNGGDTKMELPTTEILEEDKVKLVGYFNAEAVDHLLELYKSILEAPQKKPRDHSVVKTEFTSDRSIRSQIHQDIRRIFHNRIDSSTDKHGVLVLSAASQQMRNQQRSGGGDDRQRRPGKLGWADRGGEHLHFTLFKENKDTMEVISYLTRQLKTTAKTFQFAGTKDRRAVTSQRVSAYRVDAERLAAQNRGLRFAAIGDFDYQPHGLELGDLKGNEFVITLRDFAVEGQGDSTMDKTTESIRDIASNALRDLHDKGFLNYFGLQRFGSFATRTDVIGLKILKNDFQGACESLLEFNTAALAAAQDPASTEPIGSDDKARAEAIDIWHKNGQLKEALDKMPRRFSAETALLRHLSKAPQDFLGALMTIQRNLRLMYVHAYQSLVWNLATGERWKLYGDKVVEGDLVLVNEHKDKNNQGTKGAAADNNIVDCDGEVVIQAAGDDRAVSADDVFERARALTAAEAASGAYSIFDAVLPLPGYDILYPNNASGEFYKTFMASDRGGGLDPHDMRRKQRDFSLSGGYRKIIARIGEDFEVDVYRYGDENAQFVQTDMDRMKKHGGNNNNGVSMHKRDNSNGGALSDAGVVVNAADSDVVSSEGGENKKIAAVVKFQLGSSQYATMALREFSRGGIVAHKPDFGGGR